MISISCFLSLISKSKLYSKKLFCSLLVRPIGLILLRLKLSLFILFVSKDFIFRDLIAVSWAIEFTNRKRNKNNKRKSKKSRKSRKTNKRRNKRRTNRRRTKKRRN